VKAGMNVNDFFNEKPSQEKIKAEVNSWGKTNKKGPLPAIKSPY
jgi:hypothetical protein